jgi:hypothetical protein
MAAMFAAFDPLRIISVQYPKVDIPAILPDCPQAGVDLTLKHDE